MTNGTSGLVVILGLTLSIASYQFYEVPKLEKQIQALEQQVEAKDAEMKAQAEKLGELNDALYTANTKVEQLEKQAVPVSPLPSRSQGYVRELTGFQVTWYNSGGITKSGAHTEDGVTVASDPSVIKLGTWIEIDFPDGRVLKRKVQDTGGAVHGRILDVYTSATDSEVRKLGRTHDCIVRILP